MLEIKNLVKEYDNSKVAVDNVSLKIEKGDIFGFIGPNGAGKTSLIKSIVGIHDFQEGEILIDGLSIKDKPIECKSKIAYIPDNPDIYEHLSGIAYLNFIANIFKVDKKERKELINKYSELFEMTDALANLISSYSHGMKQRLVIISALIHKPKLMILDEPFVGLDPRATIILRKLMKEICEDGGSIFFSTHVLDVAEKLCNKVAIIKDAKLILTGETFEVIKDKSLEDIFMEVTSYE